MSRSFTIPYDMSRYSKMVAESGSYIAVVPSAPLTAQLGTMEVGGFTFIATIPTDSYLVEKFYPVVEQQNSVIGLKNSLLPYKLTINGES